MRSLQPIAALASLALLAMPAATVQAGDWRLHAKCSACRVVADELEARLDAEQPRNHLDLRHRLGKDGKRWGKVIDYKLSELRVIHLLDGLCAAAKQYQLVGQDSAADGSGGAIRWAKSSSLQSESSFSPEVIKQHRKELEVYCHDLLERYEEELSSALRDGELNSEAGVSDWLCLTTARHCDTTRAEEAAAAAKEAAATKGAGDAAGNSGGGGEGAGVNEAIKQQESAAPDAEL